MLLNFNENLRPGTLHKFPKSDRNYESQHGNLGII